MNKKNKEETKELNERIAKAQQEAVNAYYAKRKAQKAEQAQLAAQQEAIRSAVTTRPCPDCPFKTYKQTPVQSSCPSQQRTCAPLPISAYSTPVKAVEPDRIYVDGKIVPNK